MEAQIKKAANKKFLELKNIIKQELQPEIMEEVRSMYAPNTNEKKEGLDTIKDKILTEVQVNQQSAVAEIKYDRLKAQAFNKRYNLVVFGLSEESSPQADSQSLVSFFRHRMDFHNLSIEETYRLGKPQSYNREPRPLVVRFKHIDERWAVWNNKGSIKKDWDNPIWLQEDLPKRLRDDNRVLQRIAKTARQNPHTFQNVSIKDYQISIDGSAYGSEDFHRLPVQLQPKEVYIPRSKQTCVFFTKHSPLSNHHPSPIHLDNQSFVCVEQYLALCRANLAKDDILAKEVMESQDPADHKVITE